MRGCLGGGGWGVPAPPPPPSLPSLSFPSNVTYLAVDLDLVEALPPTRPPMRATLPRGRWSAVPRAGAPPIARGRRTTTVGLPQHRVGSVVSVVSVGVRTARATIVATVARGRVGPLVSPSGALPAAVSAPSPRVHVAARTFAAVLSFSLSLPARALAAVGTLATITLRAEAAVALLVRRVRRNPGVWCVVCGVWCVVSGAWCVRVVWCGGSGGKVASIHLKSAWSPWSEKAL